MRRAGSRDPHPPGGQPQPHRRVLCGVLGATTGAGWIGPPLRFGPHSVPVPAGHPLRTPAAAALSPRRGVGSAGAGPAPLGKAAPSARPGPAYRCGGADAPPAAPASGAVPPPRQPWPLQPDRAPQCRDRVPAAAQPPTEEGPGPPKPHPFRPSGSETFCKCSSGLSLQTPPTLQRLQLFQYHPTSRPGYAFPQCSDPLSSLQRSQRFITAGLPHPPPKKPALFLCKVLLHRCRNLPPSLQLSSALVIASMTTHST